MNTGIFVKSIIEKLDLPNKQEILNAAENLREELPETLLPVFENVNKLFTLDAAKGNKELGDYFTNKNNSQIRSAYKNVLTRKQYEELDNDKLNAMDLIQIFENAINLAENKTRKLASITEDERIEQEKYNTRIEREKRERSEKQYAEREKRVEEQIEQERVDSTLNSFINTIPLNDKLNKKDSVKLIKEEVLNQVSIMGASLVKIGDSIKLVQSMDKTMPYYDANHNLIDINALIQKIAIDKGLYNITQNKTNNNQKTQSFNYTTQINNNIPKDQSIKQNQIVSKSILKKLIDIYDHNKIIQR